MSSLTQLAACLHALPRFSPIQHTVPAACVHFRDLHGQRWLPQSSSSSTGLRHLSAAAQLQPEDDPGYHESAFLSRHAGWHGQDEPHAAGSTGTTTVARPAAALVEVLAPLSVESAALDEHTISAEGQVQYPEGALMRNMYHHWQQLQACPSARAYTERITFDEFGHRYIQQLEREEQARSRALAQLRRELEANARASHQYKSGGGIANRLVSAWLPLLQQAIEEEQQQVLNPGDRNTARRDRQNYGPYLLLLSAHDMAHLTLQTVLSRVATALPEVDDGDVTNFSGGSWVPSGPSTSYSTSSGYGSSNAADGVMSPAVLLADAIGRAVNNRVKFLRYKSQSKEHEALERQLIEELRGEQQQQQQRQHEGMADTSSSSSGSSAPLSKLQSSLAAYNRHSNREAAEYFKGQRRLQELQDKLKSLKSNQKKTLKAAQDEVHWSADVRIKIGAALLALLIENSMLPAGLPGNRARVWSNSSSSSKRRIGSGTGSSSAADDLPAFEYTTVRNGLKQQSNVRASQGLVSVLLADRSLAAALLTKVPPMLVPPVPWTSYCKGGYLTSRHWMMRTRYSSALQQELRKGMASGNYNAVLDALNVLGNTAWKVNRNVYNVMTHLWSIRSTAGGLPQQIPLKPPLQPSNGYRLVFEGGALAARSGPWSKFERRGYVLACDDARRINRNMASLKADFLLKLKVAEDFVDVPEFYYPHTVDFRGRAYPLHPSLHHLGDDSCRGLLMFAQGVPLGREGLDWLYVHLANVWGQGQDKLSFDGRRAFARSNLASILEVASDPLQHTWWQQAEKPWQALAACCEIAGALQSITPENYVSHLPVHMDGSCNGLQHYAALGRDEAGGRAVNLLPSNKPQDVYKGVAEIVACRAAADAAANKPEAMRCVSLIDRKLVKQTVMTSVYGVTPIGARAQIEARLKERRTDMKQKAMQVLEKTSQGSSRGRAAVAAAANSASWLLQSSGGSSLMEDLLGVKQPGMRDEYSWMDDKNVVWQVSKYLADQTMDAIGEMFSSARAIMGWLADCARLVAAENAPVKWHSPLGLPITQPYYKMQMRVVQTATQSFQVIANDVSSDGSSSEPQWLKARQRSAFPPNFIHSIDSTHMMLTALACSAAGICFAGVHDSFWTHAGDVSTMNRLLREKFVEMHTKQPDLLEDLLSQLQRQHPNVEFPPIPVRGKLVTSRVRNSRYFFS